jgi:hypothetical protein
MADGMERRAKAPRGRLVGSARILVLGLLCILLLAARAGRRAGPLPSPLAALRGARSKGPAWDPVGFQDPPGKSAWSAPRRRFEVDAARLTFLAVGDFGSGGRREWLDPADSASSFARPGDQRTVARGLERAAVRERPDFVLGLGDMIYPRGARTVDDPLFSRRFDDVYGAPTTPPELAALPWFLTVGNHDCESGAEGRAAAIGRTRFDRARTGFGRWRLPRAHYTREWALGETASVLRLIVLDACTLVCAGSVDGRCEGVSTAGEEAAEEQWTWLDAELSRPGARWTVVASHWPIYSRMGNGPTPRLIARLVPMLRRRGSGAAAYFSGHDHSLQHWTLGADGDRQRLDMFVSGGGGYAVHNRLNAYAVPVPEGAPRAEPAFASASHGFMAVSADAETGALRVVALAEDGETVLHEAVVFA